MDIILERGLQRAATLRQDIDEMRLGFENCYYKAQKHYISIDKPMEGADLWIDNTDYTSPVLKGGRIVSNTPQKPLRLSR